MMDIHSKSEYPFNMLSNWAPHQFEIDGVKCGSMEGFLQSLKYRNVTNQQAVCALSGKEAEAVGNKKWLWKWTHNVWWQGQKIKRSSEKFSQLIERAYMKLSENSDFAKALIKSGDAVLEYSIAGHDPFKTILTEEEFVVQLTKVRHYLLTKKSSLLEQSRKGDNKAMLELSKISDTKFANTWLVRAVMYGNEEAREILRKNPERASNMFFHLENFVPGRRKLFFNASYEAADLMELGFDDLPGLHESYIVGGLSNERIMVIGMETGYDPPDEDGFGMEIYYDCYVYDEFFHRISATTFKNDPRRAYAIGDEYIKTKNDLPNLRIDWLIEDGILKQYNY